MNTVQRLNSHFVYAGGRPASPHRSGDGGSQRSAKTKRRLRQGLGVPVMALHRLADPGRQQEPVGHDTGKPG